MRRAGQMLALASAVAMAASLTACARPTVRATLPALQSRAAFDLVCPAPWLHLYPLDARAKGVEGCGRRLVYLETCGPVGDRVQCTWQLEPISAWSTAGAPVSPSPPPAGATAPPARTTAPKPSSTMTPTELLRDRT